MLRGQGLTFSSALLWALLATGVPLFPQVVRAGEWMLPDDRMGIRTAPLLLLSRPDVQADLRLDQTQILGAHAAINELTRRAVALRGKSGTSVIAERRAIDEAQLEWLGKNLTGNQLERLRQIELRWEGPSAILSRPTVAEYLKLSAEQRQSLARIITERNAARARTPAAGIRPGADDQAFQQRTQAVLSPVQQELWVRLLGTPVQFASTTVPAGSRDTAAQQAVHVQERK